MDLRRACKGSCAVLKGVKSRYGPYAYTDGRKVCSTCEISIRWDGKYCPCCGAQLRWRSRANVSRQRRVRGIVAIPGVCIGCGAKGLARPLIRCPPCRAAHKARPAGNWDRDRRDERCNCVGSIRCTLHGGDIPYRGQVVVA